MATHRNRREAMTNIKTEMWTIVEESEGAITPWVGTYSTLEAATKTANKHLQETFEDDSGCDAPWIVKSEQSGSWEMPDSRQQVVVYRDSDQMFYFYFTQHTA